MACAQIPAKHRRRSLYNDIATRWYTWPIVLWFESGHVRFICVFSKITTLFVVVLPMKISLAKNFGKKAIIYPFSSNHLLGIKTTRQLCRQDLFLANI